MSRLFILLALLAGGCAESLGRAMVTAPHQFNPFARPKRYSPPVRYALGIDQQFEVDVGPPDATLAVSVVEPIDSKQPRGTILVLHGIWNESFWMLGTAKMLAEEGFRAVLVDLRGHGRSTGDWLTYGVREAKDLSQVIDALERRDLIAGNLGVYGISYGATTSIHLAGGDPRITAVVAVAPFSRMRDEVPDYARTMLPGVERFVSEDRLREAVDAAGRHADFNPDRSDAVAAIRRTRARVMILHGSDDWLVPPYHALRLYEAGRDHCEFVLLPMTGHVSIWFDADGEVARQTKRWFGRWLAASAVLYR
ncbi:MAG: alpha/beta hydrolase [Planctomycetaceae bacterium]